VSIDIPWLVYPFPILNRLQGYNDMVYDVDCACASGFPILSAGFEMVVLGRSTTLQDLRFSQWQC